MTRLHRDPNAPPAGTDSQGDKGPLADLSPQQLRERLELADASMDAAAWLALLAEVERRCVRAEEAESKSDRAADDEAKWREERDQPCPNHGGNCDC